MKNHHTINCNAQIYEIPELLIWGLIINRAILKLFIKMTEPLVNCYNEQQSKSRSDIVQLYREQLASSLIILDYIIYLCMYIHFFLFGLLYPYKQVTNLIIIETRWRFKQLVYRLFNRLFMCR